MKKRLILLLSVCIVLLSIVSSCSSSRIAVAQNSEVAIEVIEFEENQDKAIIMKFILTAPRGTVYYEPKTQANRTLDQDNGTYEYLLLSQMYNRRGQTDVEGRVESNAGIGMSFYSPFISLVDGYAVINDAGPSPEKEIREYAYYARPGTYKLSEGDEFVFFDIENAEYKIEIISIGE